LAKNNVFRLTLVLVLMCIGIGLPVKPVVSVTPIYIRADGSVDPPSAPIQRDGNTYTLVGDINGSLVIEKDNIVVFGNGYKLQGENGSIGVYLFGRKNVTLKEMWVLGFERGIYLECSDNNYLINNRVEKNEQGIYLFFSNNNTLIGNNVTDNFRGITLAFCKHVTMRYNFMSKNRYSFSVGQARIQFYEHDIDTSNTINGRPIYYLLNRENETVPLDAGCVYVVDSVNVTVENLTITNCEFGIVLAYSENCIIRNNTVFTNYHGICLDRSNSNLIANNNASNNGQGGIFLYWSHQNLLINNTATNNRGVLGVVGGSAGIYLEDTYYNVLVGNFLANNSQGIGVDDSSGIQIIGNNITNNFLRGIVLWNGRSSVIAENNVVNNRIGIEVRVISKDNRIYHNNFINNDIQVNIIGENLRNFWNQSYPLGGNYWSHYNGTDLFSGPRQNEAGMDGIGDSPYIMDESNIDNYPLMNPWCPTDLSILNVTCSEFEFYIGHTVNVTAQITNRGAIAETFEVTCKYELDGVEHVIGLILVVDLPSNATATLTFDWTPMAVAVYRLKVEVTVLPDETYPADNNVTCSVAVKVKMVGDVNGDGCVDIGDIAMAALAYGSYPCHPRWNNQADVNRDGRVDIQDLAVIAQRFGSVG